MKPMRTHVYIDGFNLYNGILKNKPEYKWLNVLALSQCILSQNNEINAVHFFTAKVNGKRDPDQPNRQRIYFRALNTLPKVRIHLGHFLSKQQKMLAAEGWPKGNKFHLVMRTEEKGSDVNLATQLLVDAFDDVFDVAVIFSNDGDLKSAISVVRNRFKKTIGIVYPRRPISRALKPLAHFTITPSSAALKFSQFPDEMKDAKGAFRKPKSWRAK